MMRRRKAARPVLESMESKFLLSAQGVAPTAMILARSHGSLSGSVHGHYTESSVVPDAGKTVSFSGAGRVGGLGQVNFSGHFGTPGFIASGHATGTLVLSNGRGTVTLALEGPTQPGFSAPPSAFSYTIVKGTGAYARSHGSGVLTIGLVPDQLGGPVTLQHLASGQITIHFA
ncbi:MAG TPA: hypothetical protein VGH33_15490 [Isosphaeraceae bacterium]